MIYPVIDLLIGPGVSIRQLKPINKLAIYQFTTFRHNRRKLNMLVCPFHVVIIYPEGIEVYLRLGEELAEAVVAHLSARS